MNFRRRFNSLTAFYVFVVLSVVFHSCQANGKKCQQYGHSCLGGHGKRSDELASGVMQQNSELQKINDPLLNRVVNLMRQLISQRIDSLQRHSPQAYDMDITNRDDFDSNQN